MGIKQVATKTFIEYLKELGLIVIRHEASHWIWDYPDSQKKLSRPLVVRVRHKEIPLTHIHTNLKSLGKSKSDFETWLKKHGYKKAGGKKD